MKLTQQKHDSSNQIIKKLITNNETRLAWHHMTMIDTILPMLLGNSYRF